MKYFINSTADYHRKDLKTLGWELTVCNALEPADSPCRKALQTPSSFGRHLHHFLSQFWPLDKIERIVEIGGGLGYLMRDFLTLNPRMKAHMIDISPYLLDRQRETLKSFQADFELADIFDIPQGKLSRFDLALLNENLGDMPSMVAAPEDTNISDENAQRCINRLRYFSRTYGLPLDHDKNVNIGAMEIVEILCLAGIPCIYMSEHSCEAAVPDGMKPYLSFQSAGLPERISLKGHQEFTIKFSYLQKIAEMFNYTTRRGPFADFLPLQLSDKIKTALRMEVPINDGQEIIRQFVYDLYKYEYLILTKGGSR